MTKTIAEQAHMNAVAMLGCLQCLEEEIEDCPCDVHHCGTGGGGTKNHMKVIGLCPEHHRWKLAIDKKGKERRHIEAKFLAYVAEHCSCHTCKDLRLGNLSPDN